jgi:hypothetical protein
MLQDAEQKIYKEIDGFLNTKRSILDANTTRQDKIEVKINDPNGTL